MTASAVLSLIVDWLNFLSVDYIIFSRPHHTSIITSLSPPFSEAIARQLALALNQNNSDKAVQCIDSIGALKKDIKFQITYTIEDKPTKSPM